MVEILGGALILAIGGAVASVTLARRYALWMTSVRDEKSRSERDER
jgi:hypothetical protein